jgi:cytochrome o ubiquinol oxidase subunit 2
MPLSEYYSDPVDAKAVVTFLTLVGFAFCGLLLVASLFCVLRLAFLVHVTTASIRHFTTTGMPNYQGWRGYMIVKSLTHWGRAALVATSLVVAGCNASILDPQGPIGAAEKTILLNSLVIMLAIVVPTIIATLVFAWWFRESNTSATFRPTFVYSGRIEVVVWSIPILVILFLGGIIWIGSHDLDPAKAPISQTKALDVQVVSLDWKWLFIYPDQGIASINEVVAPVGTPIHFVMTSSSVMNAFFVPQLGSMIYTMNGMITQLYLQADREGDFYGRSAQFSGDGFPGMEFTLRAVTLDGFDAWTRGAKGKGPNLDQAQYTELAKQSMDVKPMTYGSVDPHLFHAIASQALPPGPGPGGDRESSVSPRSTGGR